MAPSGAAEPPSLDAIVTRRAQSSIERTKGSYLAIALTVGSVAILLAFQEHIRSFEAALAGSILGSVLPWRSGSGGTVIWFDLGGEYWTGLFITFQCSTIVLWLACLTVAILTLLVRRTNAARAVAALAIALVVTLAANLTRYGAAVWALKNWGTEGFDRVHYWYGAFFVLAVTIAMGVFILWYATAKPGTYKAKH